MMLVCHSTNAESHALTVPVHDMKCVKERVTALVTVLQL